ncbi:hypothetical protein chiPu_0010215 [Chiloscyllium punctatum]|uniref:Collagen IV NC1 domain-containing protein n=1 Tax=Chiloscyllium punctatum TaxID=137246 RepID=A0A401SMV8_CHIPU|nr:hypothetical protein [Chiloscyllium punctatum]
MQFTHLNQWIVEIFPTTTTSVQFPYVLMQQQFDQTHKITIFSGSICFILQGYSGEQGIQGIQGQNGNKGQKGEPGLQGQPGQSGMPGMKGIKGDKGNAGVMGNQKMELINCSGEGKNSKSLIYQNLTFEIIFQELPV